MIATDKSQSARLLACGVPADTADMCWYKGKAANKEGYTLVSENYLKNTKFSQDFIHAWSLSRLLALIPHTIETGEDEDYYFSLAQEYAACLDYKAAYKSCWSDWEDDCVSKCSTDPIEACVQLIEWLMQNNYKLNEIKEK